MLGRINPRCNRRHYTQNHDHENGRLGRADLASLDGGNLTKGYRLVIAVNYPVMHRGYAKFMRGSRGGCDDHAIARLQNATVAKVLGYVIRDVRDWLQCGAAADHANDQAHNHEWFHPPLPSARSAIRTSSDTERPSIKRQRRAPGRPASHAEYADRPPPKPLCVPIVLQGRTAALLPRRAQALRASSDSTLIHHPARRGPHRPSVLQRAQRPIRPT